MKGLTLTQPWATLVAIGAKSIETRSWSTSYRGPIAIHAAKGFPKWASETCGDDPFRTELQKAGVTFRAQPVRHWYHSPYPYRLDGGLPIGAIVAVATLVEVVLTGDMQNRIGHGGKVFLGARGTWDLTAQEGAFGDFAPGRYAWMLGHVIRLPEPIPCKGELGLWTVPVEIESRILETTR